MPILDAVATWIDQRIQHHRVQRRAGADQGHRAGECRRHRVLEGARRRARGAGDRRLQQRASQRVAQTSLREMIGSSAAVDAAVRPQARPTQLLKDVIGAQDRGMGRHRQFGRNPRRRHSRQSAGRHEPPGPGRAREAGARHPGLGRSRRWRRNSSTPPKLYATQPGSAAAARHEHHLRNHQGARRHHPDADRHGGCDESGRRPGSGDPGAAARRSRRDRRWTGGAERCADWTGSSRR